MTTKAGRRGGKSRDMKSGETSSSSSSTSRRSIRASSSAAGRGDNLY